MKQRKQDYITIYRDGSVRACECENTSEINSVNDAADIVYRLSRIADEATGESSVAPNAHNAADVSEYTEVTTAGVTCSLADDKDVAGQSLPIALIMASAKTTKRLIPAATEAGFAPCVVYTHDRRFESHLKTAASTVCLGDKYSEVLFSNAYAVLTAAEECGASVVFLCDESAVLAEVDGFLARAAARGLRVFKALSSDTPALGWVLCSTDKEVSVKESWRTCHACGLNFDESGLAAGHYLCPACGTYLRMSSDERINDLLDADSFTEWDCVMSQSDPLEFSGYVDKLKAQRKKTGLEEAVRTGEGRIAGLPVAIGIMDSGFLMGSMGSVVGEKLARLVERATEKRLPVVIFSASGGARMQEGLISLMQMAKVSFALNRHAEAHLPYISVITDPTTGGVTASFATQGDIILAEPGALIGFAGQRVIKDTIKQELPKGFQTAEFALEHGLIDAIVERNDLRATLAHLLAIHAVPAVSFDEGVSKSKEQDVLITYESVCANLENGTNTYNTITYGDLVPMDAVLAANARAVSLRFRDRVAGIARLFVDSEASSRRRLERAINCGSFDAEGGVSLEGSADHEGDIALLNSPDNAWENVQLARNVHRPTALSYIDAFVDGFIELHGDRTFGDDGAMVCGVGWIGGRAVTIVAQEKGANLKERIRRNFGCPQPEGYRKSLRLMRQAEKFGRPVVCLVDTQGAFCGTQAEERGQGNAIAENLIGLAGLRVPVISVLLGEGGSGGALALAVADKVAMQEHAVYSILSPEGFASILWKDRSRAAEAAAVMKMSAPEVYRMGVVDAVLSEGEGPAHENPGQAAAEVYTYITQTLDDLCNCPIDELLQERYKRFMRF